MPSYDITVQSPIGRCRLALRFCFVMYTGAAVILVKFENKSDIVGNRCSIIMVGSTSSTVVDELLILRALSACDLIRLFERR